MTAGFDALFDTFTHSAHRLETLPAYAIPDEDPSYLAFRDGLPRPERSVRTSQWMRRIALTTAAGKTWSRTRVIDTPLTEYQRWQIPAYLESQTVGEQIRVVRREEVVLGEGPDFWLFDDDTDVPWAVLMEYGPGGEFTGFEVRRDRASLDELIRRRHEAEAMSIALAEFVVVLGGDRG